MHIYLEPVCPLFWGFNPPKEGLFQSKHGSFGFQVSIHTCTHIRINTNSIYVHIFWLCTNQWLWQSSSGQGIQPPWLCLITGHAVLNKSTRDKAGLSRKMLLGFLFFLGVYRGARSAKPFSREEVLPFCFQQKYSITLKLRRVRPQEKRSNFNGNVDFFPKNKKQQKTQHMCFSLVRFSSDRILGGIVTSCHNSH